VKVLGGEEGRITTYLKTERIKKKIPKVATKGYLKGKGMKVKKKVQHGNASLSRKGLGEEEGEFVENSGGEKRIIRTEKKQCRSFRKEETRWFQRGRGLLPCRAQTPTKGDRERQGGSAFSHSGKRKKGCQAV